MQNAGWNNIDIHLERAFFHIMHNTYPWRSRAVYFVNCGYIISIVAKLLMPLTFLSGEGKPMRDRMHFLSSVNELEKRIPRSCIPTELGGDARYTAQQFAADVEHM
jgi:hypothetical protein